MLDAGLGAGSLRPAIDGVCGSGVIERRDDALQALAGCLVGCLRRLPRIGAHRCHDGDLVLHRIENGHHGGAHQDAIGDVQRVGRHVRKALDEPYGVVADVPEHAGRHGRQLGRQLQLGFGEEGAQRGERRQLVGPEGVGLRNRRAVDGGRVALGAPYEVGLEADHRVAAAGRPASTDSKRKLIGRPAAIFR